MFLSETNYLEAIERNLLLPIDNIVNDAILNTIHPGAVELLTYYGDGELYGIPTEMHISALFYNKSLFDSNSIPLLEEQINW